MNLIRRCEEVGYKIYGIDGFYIEGKKIQPSMEDSVTLSKVDGFHQYAVAIEFVRKHAPKGLKFEVVCGE